MRSVTAIIGIILIISGISILVYRGYSYNTQEKIAQIGNVQVTAEQEKNVYISPMVGGIVLIAGIVILVFGRRNGS